MGQLFCTNCGQKLPENSKFCPACGQRVEQSAPQQPAFQPSGSSPLNDGGPIPTVMIDVSRRSASYGIFDYWKRFWVRYAEFEGRSSRPEFWWSFLMCMIMCFVFTPLMIFVPVMYFILSPFALAFTIPYLAVCARRLHDIGKPGMYLLLWLVPLVGGIVLLVWFAQEGEPRANRFGEDEMGTSYLQQTAWNGALSSRDSSVAERFSARF